MHPRSHTRNGLLGGTPSPSGTAEQSPSTTQPESPLLSGPQCFVIHAHYPPENWRHTLKRLQEKLSPPFRVSCDEDFGGDVDFGDEAINAIKRSDLVICLFDGLTPNVCFEYGASRALQRPMISLVAEQAKVDIKRYFDKADCDIDNPSLNLAKHLSNRGVKNEHRFDNTIPDAPITAVERALTGSVDAIKLSQQVLESWAKRFECGEDMQSADNDRLVKKIKDSEITLGKPILDSNFLLELAKLR